MQAICDFVHQHIQFGYEFASPTKTAWEAFNERKGVCRDFAHLAITLCRCMNIPARYCTGYLGDIGRPADPSPMDFAGWFEAYLGGAWHTFDPRNNVPRIGRVLIARGRDAADVAITTTFGPNTLQSFRVWTDEVDARVRDDSTAWGVTMLKDGHRPGVGLAHARGRRRLRVVLQDDGVRAAGRSGARAAELGQPGRHPGGRQRAGRRTRPRTGPDEAGQLS